MKITVPNSEIKEDNLDDLFDHGKKDKALVKITGAGAKKGEGRGEEIPALIKELVAIDGAAGVTTQKDIASIYGVTQTSVSHLSNGKLGSNVDSAISEELKETTDRVRHKIENAAIAKLMSTLDLYDPEGLETQMEVVTAAQKLALVVDKISGRGDKTGANVQVIFYNPKQRSSKDYEVIEVG